MAQTFACPHCEATYRALPTLVGRKVRCSSCKNVFQLQHTGIAIKIGEDGKKSDPALEKQKGALETKKPDAGKQVGAVPQKQTAAAKTRPQTRAIRRKTERIQNMRSSLQEAAQQALQVEEKVASERIEKKDLRKPSKAKAKRVTDSHVVTLSGAAETEQKVKRSMGYILLGIVGFFVCVYFLMGSQSPQEQALSDFSQPIEDEYLKHPLRMDGYGKRLWRTKRQFNEPVPIVLNVNRATCASVVSYEWPEVVAFMAKTIEKMQVYDLLPIWINPGDKERIDKLWKDFPNKTNIAEFYGLLKKEDVKYYAMNELPSLMLNQGIPQSVVYVTSMLLLPGLPQENNEKIFGGDMPIELLITEFNGVSGSRLFDSGAAYDIETLPHYSGLLVGFTGISGESGEYWKILDVRVAKNMSYYYELAENPLIKYAKIKSQSLRVKMRQQAEEDGLIDPFTGELMDPNN